MAAFTPRQARSPTATTGGVCSHSPPKFSKALAAAALAIGSVSGSVTREFILAAAFVFGVGRAFEAPTQQTLLPSVVPVSLFPRAVAASASTTQLATITGPAIGGILYAFGAAVPYTTCGALFLTSAVLLAFVHIERFVSSRSPISFEAFFAGIAYIRRNPIVLGVISLDLFAVLLGGTTALLPIFADEVFHTGPEGLGLLRAAPAIGALAITAILTTSPLTRRVGRIMFVCVACFGLRPSCSRYRSRSSCRWRRWRCWVHRMR